MGAIWSTFVGFFEQVLMLFAVFTGNLALGIILFTICARLFILPLTLQSIRSSREMQKVQPLMKEVQRKHGKDQKKLQEEMMKIYREHKVNPAAGCLPMLLQIPIFIGVYQAIIHLMTQDQQQYLGDEMRAAVVDGNIEPLFSQTFLGPLWELSGLDNGDIIPNLLSQDFFGVSLGLPVFSEGFSVFNGAEYLILPIVAIALQFVQQQMAMPRTQDPQQKMMAQIMMFLPLFMGYIMVIVPTGTVLYWATSSVVGIVQQYFITGWGSLTNFLPFLPEVQRGPPIAALTSSTSQAVAEVEDEQSDGTPARERYSFSSVMGPLMELQLAGAGADGGAGTGSAEFTTDDDGDDGSVAPVRRRPPDSTVRYNRSRRKHTTRRRTKK